MSKVVTDNQYYTAIANAIRALTGTNNRYTPAQMASAIYGYIAGGIDLSDIESYFITDVINAMRYVEDLGTDDWVHHIVITDTHFTKNYGHSTAIVKAMQDTGKFSKVIHLGDITDDAQEANYTEAIANYGQFNGDLLFAIGNHDAMGDYGWATYYYNNLLDEDTDIVVDSSSNYNYYWDDAEHQIRYIVYDYHTGGDAYALNRVKDAPSGYAVITMCHYRDQIESSILIPLIGHQLEYIGNFAGHSHVDSKKALYANMYNQVILTNDGWANDNANYVKVDDTNDSQAITIMSINTSTRNVKFRRIGIANSLTKAWEYTWVKGGSVEAWIKGGMWGLGVLTESANAYYCTKLYPCADNGNNLTYTVYSTSGTISYIYVIGINSSGDFQTNQRLTQAASAVWNRRMWITKYGTTNHFTSAVASFLISINNANDDIVSTNDIVVSSEHVDLGVTFSNVTWDTGYYLSSSGKDTTDTDAVTSYGFDVLPSTQYRFYVDDADWAGSNFMYAYLYSDKSSEAKNDFTPHLSSRGRAGSGTAGTKEITFTTRSDECYCRMSIRGQLAAVTDWQNKCHLEIVTS